MAITYQQLARVFPKLDQNLVSFINEAMAKYQINTPKRMAAFIAQCAHESMSFRRFEENLNYSAQGLLTTFHKYFANISEANQYARQPKMIANKVYAFRMGNGGPGTNDGYNYRGRGAIQLTGKDNYQSFAADNNMTLQQAVDYLSTPQGAIVSAGWFWSKRGLNALADAGDMKEITHRINGGYNGLDERIAFYNSLLHVL